jgi:hypothetical protein
VTVTTNVQSPTFYRFESLVSNLVDPQTYVSPALYFEINVSAHHRHPLTAGSRVS